MRKRNKNATVIPWKVDPISKFLPVFQRIALLANQLHGLWALRGLLIKMLQHMRSKGPHPPRPSRPKRRLRNNKWVDLFKTMASVYFRWLNFISPTIVGLKKKQAVLNMSSFEVRVISLSFKTSPTKGRWTNAVLKGQKHTARWGQRGETRGIWDTDLTPNLNLTG